MCLFPLYPPLHATAQKIIYFRVQSFPPTLCYSHTPTCWVRHAAPAWVIQEMRVERINAFTDEETDPEIDPELPE